MNINYTTSVTSNVILPIKGTCRYEFNKNVDL
jgi:hypothetical protein